MSLSKAPQGAFSVGEQVQVTIEKLVIGGAGLARPQGFVLFIQDAAPGDVLDVEVTAHHKNHGEAKILRIVTPGPGRRERPCPFAIECGGCNWQHIDELTQQEQKTQFVLENLRKFLPGREIPWESLSPSPHALYYRNRVQPRWRNGQLGYYKRRKHEFLAVSDCHVVEEPLRTYFQDPSKISELRDVHEETQIELRLNPDGQTSWSRRGDESDGFAFSQVNRFQNEELVRTALDWTDGLDPSEIWDLYAGSGNFTFPLAEKFPKATVTAIELADVLVRRGRERAEKEKRKGLQFRVSNVESWLRRRLPSANAFVVVDPPRAGTGDFVMKALASSQARSILYISCHPVSLARDLQSFFTSPSGPRWKLSRVKAFEMFPQTDHVETMVRLDVDSPRSDANLKK